MEIKRIIVGSLQTNCYFLVYSGELAAVDPGDEAKKIVDEILKTKAVCKFIVITHNHFDHTGAMADLAKKFNAPVYSREDQTIGRELKVGNTMLKVVDTPGHTQDGICIFGEDFVLTGDTIFDGNIGRTDLPGGSNSQMAASLRKLDSLISDGATVYPGHGDIFIYKKGTALDYLQWI